MSLQENTTDRPPVERSQALTTFNKQTCRLYPSLPSTDRYEVRSLGEKLHAAAVHHPAELQQSDAPAASGDVRMKAQILILEEQRQELLSINEKWAKEHRTMCQYYKEKIRELKAASQPHDHSHFEEKAGNGDVSPELLKAVKEVKELRVQNSTLSRRGKHQHEEIRRLNKALEEALLTTQPLDLSSKTQQDVWKHQAEVYKEDFLKERRDREKLKEKYLELEKKFRKVYSELRVLKPQVLREISVPNTTDVDQRCKDDVSSACNHSVPRAEGSPKKKQSIIIVAGFDKSSSHSTVDERRMLKLTDKHGLAGIRKKENASHAVTTRAVIISDLS